MISVITFFIYLRYPEYIQVLDQFKIENKQLRTASLLQNSMLKKMQQFSCMPSKIEKPSIFISYSVEYEAVSARRKNKLLENDFSVIHND